MELVTLKYPIERKDGDPITALSIRRPRLRDINAMNKAIKDAGGSLAEITAAAVRATDAASIAAATGEAPGLVVPQNDPDAAMAGAVAMLASMNDLDPDVILDLDPEDFAELQTRIAGFSMAVRPETR